MPSSRKAAALSSKREPTLSSASALIALPADDWEFAEWRRARVNLDYHIEVHDFLYSVPHALIRAEVEVRITARSVEIFHRGQRVGVHQRRYMGRKHGTDPDHMCLVFGSATRLRSAIGLRRSQAEEAVTVPARARHRFGDLR